MRKLLFFWILGAINQIIKCRPVQEQLPKKYSITNAGLRRDIQIINGQSIFKTFQTVCNELKISETNCKILSGRVSFDYYSVHYSPSRPTSTIEDFYAERTDILKYLKNRFNHTSYLEIGCQYDVNFNMMKDLFEVYVGVDPQQGGTMRMTSDDFFQQNQQKFDLIFIDGDHNSEQVWKDIVNSLNSLTEGGSVVLHDMIPLLKDIGEGGNMEVWNDDAWKAAVAMRLASDYEIIVVDIDHGCGIIRKRPNTHPLPQEWINSLLPISPLPGHLLPGTHSLTLKDFFANIEIFYRFVSMVEMRDWLEV